jgi:hypothetical protein
LIALAKGKVEAGVKYVKQNALYGEVFVDWDGLEAHLHQWLEQTANARLHGTTGEPPRQRYDRDEQRHMQRYLTPAYLSQIRSSTDTRLVDKTGLLAWKANKYSAPLAYQQARVGVREDGTQLVLSALDSGQEIARHALSPGKGAILKNTAHYRNKQELITELETFIGQSLGDPAGSHLCALLKHTNPGIYKDQLRGLKALLNRYPMPSALLVRLCKRTQLTTAQIGEYLAAYAAHPERRQAQQEPPAEPSEQPSGHRALRPYAALTQPDAEVDHDRLH